MEENENIVPEVEEKSKKKFSVFSIVMFVLSLIMLGVFITISGIPAFTYIYQVISNPSLADILIIIAVLPMTIMTIPFSAVLDIAAIISLHFDRKKDFRKVFSIISICLLTVITLFNIATFIAVLFVGNTGEE